MSESAAANQAGEQQWTDESWTSPDGLSLHYRDYPGPPDLAPVICIPGLTRNARDFEPIADAFAGKRRILCVELRGRGDSDYAKDPATYVPLQYLADMEALLAQAVIARFVAIGTSLGGLITMMIAAGGADRLAGAVLNDIGPVIEPAGMARIREYVGQGRSYSTWMHAARALKEQNEAAFPDYAISDWLRMAKRLMQVGGNGRITYDYDMKIAEPFNTVEPAEAVDLWPAYRALAGRPVLTLRGELSDILSPLTLTRMGEEIPDAHTVTVAHRGHAPSLEEPEAQAAIASLLDRCE